MSVTITVRDESASGETYHEMPLVFPTECITVREIIRERVYQEVQDYHRKQHDLVFHGFVQPNDTERVLNGKRTEYRFKQPRQIDWKEQYERAITAFQSNGFLVLIDDRQADSLDQVVTIRPETNVSFVKLTLLVGG